LKIISGQGSNNQQVKNEYYLLTFHLLPDEFSTERKSK
jgi:hypothetical protein